MSKGFWKKIPGAPSIEFWRNEIRRHGRYNMLVNHPEAVIPQVDSILVRSAYGFL